MEITAKEQNKEKGMKRIEDNLRDLWDNIKRTNVQIIGVPEGEEKKKGSAKIFEKIIVKNFPNMGKEIVTQVQGAKRVPYRINHSQHLEAMKMSINRGMHQEVVNEHNGILL